VERSQLNHDRILNTIVDEVHRLITTDIWMWDGKTKRRSGAIVNSPRNIVDTANLVNSLVDFGTDGNTITITISDYAYYVHEGTTNMQAREFVRTALDNLGLDYTTR
jgi:hypothetical protein